MREYVQLWDLSSFPSKWNKIDRKINDGFIVWLVSIFKFVNSFWLHFIFRFWNWFFCEEKLSWQTLSCVPLNEVFRGRTWSDFCFCFVLLRIRTCFLKLPASYSEPGWEPTFLVRKFLVKVTLVGSLHWKPNQLKFSSWACSYVFSRNSSLSPNFCVFVTSIKLSIDKYYVTSCHLTKLSANVCHFAQVTATGPKKQKVDNTDYNIGRISTFYTRCPSKSSFQFKFRLTYVVFPCHNLSLIVFGIRTPFLHNDASSSNTQFKQEIFLSVDIWSFLPCNRSEID